MTNLDSVAVRTVRARAIPVESCVFIGSKDVDLAAARAAGVEAIRHKDVELVSSPEAEAEPPTPPNPWLDALG